jgi:hypothetical protein
VSASIRVKGLPSDLTPLIEVESGLHINQVVESLARTQRSGGGPRACFVETCILVLASLSQFKSRSLHA